MQIDHNNTNAEELVFANTQMERWLADELTRIGKLNERSRASEIRVALKAHVATFRQSEDQGVAA